MTISTVTTKDKARVHGSVPGQVFDLTPTVAFRRNEQGKGVGIDRKKAQ